MATYNLLAKQARTAAEMLLDEGTPFKVTEFSPNCVVIEAEPSPSLHEKLNGMVPHVHLNYLLALEQDIHAQMSDSSVLGSSLDVSDINQLRQALKAALEGLQKIKTQFGVTP